MQIISTLCDICHDDGDEEPAVQTIIISINKKAIENDLCQLHIDALERAVEQYFDIGRRPGVPSLASGKGKSSGPDGDHVCDQCGRFFPTLQGLAMHRTRAHKILSQSKEAIRRREEKANGGQLPSGMTHSEADALLDAGRCIYDDSHGPFPNRAGAGSHLRGQHGVSLSSIGLSRPPGSHRASKSP